MGAYWFHVYLLIFIVILWGLEKKFPKVVASAEESLLVLVISAIMVVSFGQVIARYGFNTGWSAALEFNTVCFSWLILLGMGYGIKTSLHLGVDIIVKAVPPPMTKALSLFAAACCMLYGLILLDSAWVALLGAPTRGGAIEYWLKMYKIGIGSEELHYPELIQDMFGIQSRVHRWLVLLVLPVGLALLVFRSLQAFVDIATGRRKLLISGHEAEDLVEESKHILKD
ncbi:MAG: TRAP transporter small permease [Candidatus Accumulibacter sp.]|uniref:TRAP transporter small permease n=1 Tax=Accumulibacter sp. TaxID=2053492 RepID=UPI0019E8CED8|nr:TRAP transporter small permease [Accumulibacter sp.]MBE2258812.1 TRAP transporter small permease [Paracoccaceae bacterium]MCP5249000.1 TRAP transporter small permease [Accumulibacter sp.]